jgi:hypothetical protein
MSSDSSLSPPPDNLVSATDTVAATQPVANGRKRRTATTSRTKSTATQLAEADDVAQQLPSPKRRAAKKVKVASQDAPAELPPSTHPKRGAAKKAIVDEEIMEGEFDVEVSVKEIDKSKATTDNKVTAKKPANSKKRKAEDDGDHEEKPKKTTKPRTKPVQKDLPPLAERSTDSKLLMGAHVSTAGGKSSSF